MRSLARLALVSLVLGFATHSNAQNQTSLKNAYKGCFLVGAALNPAEFSGRDQQSDAIIKAQFDTISPENVLKWEIVHPQPGTYDFSLADQYVEFGEKNHMFIIGHNLVWHAQVPKWVFEDKDGKSVTRDELLARMRDHINTVVGRYKGRINGWDVVNEALNEDGTLRQSPWMKIIGEDYLEKAFEYAHDADPKAELYYNDYNLENEAKRKGAIELVKKLKAKGVTITGVGVQEHVSLDWPSPQQVEATITELGDLGVKVMITELDVDVLPPTKGSHGADVSLNVAADPKLNPYPNGLPEAVEQQLTQRYADLFGAYAEALWTGYARNSLGRDGSRFLEKQLAGQGAHELSAALRSQIPAQGGGAGSGPGRAEGEAIGQRSRDASETGYG